MTISLHNLHPNPGATKAKKRLGRGRGTVRSGMRRLWLSTAALGCSALVLASTAEAAATTTVGQLFTPTANCGAAL